MMMMMGSSQGARRSRLGDERKKRKAAKRKRSNESSKAISYFTKVVGSVDVAVAVAVAVAVVINVAFKCAFHGQTRQRQRQRLTTPSVRLNYVRVLRVLADFVIRFSLELTHNYGQCQQHLPLAPPLLPRCIAVFLVVVLVVVATRFSLATCIPRIAKAHRELTGLLCLGSSVRFWFGNLLWVKWAPK